MTSDDREPAIPARVHDNVATPADVELIVLLYNIRLSPIQVRTIQITRRTDIRMHRFVIGVHFSPTGPLHVTRCVGRGRSMLRSLRFSFPLFFWLLLSGTRQWRERE